MNDSDLLRRFVDEHSQEAFAELVRRRVGLVYAAALRQVGGDAHRAEDVTQEVFIDLARKARALSRHPALIGWLYTSTHFAAAKCLRAEQRRARREQEAHAMHDLSASPAVVTEWDRVQPVLDGAMHELGERDRQTVLLRFFDQQPFARIGEQLGLSENAAQKSVERALERLQVALARRGVTSSAAAVGVALASQAGATVPPALAASVTGAALAGAAAAGGVATGVLGWLSAGKILAGLGGVAVVAAGGVSYVAHQRALEAEARLRAEQQAAEHREAAWQASFGAMRDQLVQVEQRAKDADVDSAKLLQAVEALRVAPATTTVAPPPDVTARLSQELSYQQALAKRRATDAKARAKIESEAAAGKSGAALYESLMEVAANYAASADFPAGVRAFNSAMQAKPADLAVTDRVRQLQATLRAQNVPMEIALVSDGVTDVSLVGPYGQRPPSPLHTAAVKVLPGNYEVIGRRPGYRDVVIPVQVRADVPPPVITVACTSDAAP